jgi:hypothetical protein
MSRPLSTFSVRRIVAALATMAALMGLPQIAHSYAFGYSGCAISSGCLADRQVVALELFTTDPNSPAYTIYSWANSSSQATIGSYSSNGFHDSNSTNYIADGADRDYFDFDLSSVQGVTLGDVKAATLVITNYTISSNTSYTVGAFTGDVGDLLSGANGASTYQNLGFSTGGAYSSPVLLTADGSGYVSFISLNTNFINDLYSALGLTVGNVAQANCVDCIVIAGDATPEPTSWALMILGLGGVGAAMRRLRRGTVETGA